MTPKPGSPLGVITHKFGERGHLTRPLFDRDHAQVRQSPSRPAKTPSVIM
jgi:hypothetical protein